MLAMALCVSLVAASPAEPQEISGVAIERRLADRFKLEVGDTVALTTDPAGRPSPFRIEAIYLPKADPATALRGEYDLRFHLPDLAALLGGPDRVDRFGVRVAPGISPDSAAQRLNQSAFGYRAYPSDSIARESSKTFLVVSRFHRAIGVIAILASAIFLLCIMLLKVEERRLDAAVMRLVGISRATVFKAFLLEACLLAGVGSVVGVGLAAVATVATNWFYQRKFETTLVFANLTADLIAFGVGLSLLLGLVAGTLAAARLVRAHPLSLWRRT